MIPVECYFALSALLFFIGVYGFVTRRNLIAMLISVELVLNAVDINFAAINRLLYPNGMEGMFMTLFVIGVAAAESAVAIAIIINVYRNFHSDSVDSIKSSVLRIRSSRVVLCVSSTSSANRDTPCVPQFRKWVRSCCQD